MMRILNTLPYRAHIYIAFFTQSDALGYGGIGLTARFACYNL